MKNNKTVIAFTDGSCNWKNGLGGSGVYLTYLSKKKTISKGYKSTKTGRMEIKALILALRAIKNKKDYKILIYSDSKYVINSVMKNWVFNWESFQFVGKANEDLWRQFLVEYRKFPPGSVELRHVKGHTGKQDFISKGNEMADVLADYKTQEKYIDDIYLD